MERIIVPKTTPDMEAFFGKIMDTGMGVPETVTSAPTSEQIKPNTWMKHGTDLYLRFSDGVTLKFSGTLVS